MKPTPPGLRADLIGALRAAGPVPLYVDDDTLHRLIAPHLTRDKFRAALLALEEKHGFPPANVLWRGRYWPKCKAWLDDAEGMTANAETSRTVGQDVPDAPAWRQTRLQNRPKRPPVLDRQPGAPVRNDGLSGRDNRAAGNRALAVVGRSGD